VTDWDRIVLSYGPMVFGAAWRILGHAADTEDVVQEVFLEAYRLRAAGRVRHLGGLLRRLAACRALDRLRQRQRWSPHALDGLALASRDDGPEEAAIGNELAGRLREAIGRLAPREAEVFCLRCFEDLSYQQIAEALHISSGAAAAALHKARGKLEALLSEANTRSGP
jgi:RNA polymerase sigma-70 factor (ECF subfamily)